MNQITIRIESLKSIRGDVNKKIATYLKTLGIRMIDGDVIVLSNDPGRCWIKKPGATACTAHG